MSTQIIIKQNGVKKIIYNDKSVKISPESDILLYKCPHSNCDAVFFSQDDLNQHRILEHGEVPKNLTLMPVPSSTKYFSKNQMARLSGKIQRKNLEYTLLALGIDMKQAKDSILKKLSGANGRRNKA